jgi:hypothetical protein
MLGSPPSLARVLKRALVDRDLTLVLPFVSQTRVLVNAQSLIAGRDASTSISCWKGRVLASISFEVLHALRSNGPAAVVRIVDNRQMSEAAVKLVRRFHLSGFYGLDFRIDDLNDAYLIEMNPRATQSSHLNLGKNRDLVSGFVAAVSGQNPAEKESATAPSVIALFPNEWESNPESEFLRTAYHDVPWSEPELVRVLMKKKSRAAKRSSVEN